MHWLGGIHVKTISAQPSHNDPLAFFNQPAAGYAISASKECKRDGWCFFACFLRSFSLPKSFGQYGHWILGGRAGFLLQYFSCATLFFFSVNLLPQANLQGTSFNWGSWIFLCCVSLPFSLNTLSHPS